MALVITPEAGVPLPDSFKPVDIKDALTAAQAACRTAALIDSGSPLPDDTPQCVKDLFLSVTAPAALPITPQQLATYKTSELKKLDILLSRYDQELVDVSLRLRSFVTNKLLEETENPDPKIRVRALEMLGKIKEVGLFVERTETTVVHKTTDELAEEIRRKLEKFMGTAEVINAEVVHEQGEADWERAGPVRKGCGGHCSHVVIPEPDEGGAAPVESGEEGQPKGAAGDTR